MPTENSKLVAHHRVGNLIVFDILSPEISDATTSSELREIMAAATARLPSTGIVVDLTACDFIGSIGLLAFMALRRENPGVPIVLVGVAESIHDTLHYSRLLGDDNDEVQPIFHVYKDVAEAVAKLN